MKIYTKKGDKGQTFLFGGGPYPKDDRRVEAYGTVDELNSVLGCAIAALPDAAIVSILQEVQKQLFTLGAELATVAPSLEMKQGYLNAAHIQGLEKQIDDWEAELQPLKKFVLPGGTMGSAWLHLARTLCRRAERRVVTLSFEGEVRPEVITYLNRLSDWLFVLARLVNHRESVPDILWEGILK